jgi:hypothetical protein
VLFEIDDVGDMVGLTVTHDELKTGSDMHRKISSGWPRVLSGADGFAVGRQGRGHP